MTQMILSAIILIFKTIQIRYSMTPITKKYQMVSMGSVIKVFTSVLQIVMRSYFARICSFTLLFCNTIFTLGLSSFSTCSFSDDEDFTPFGEKIIDGHPSSNETNHELEQSLKRLALLDKTQEEIEKISKVFCGVAIRLE